MFGRRGWVWKVSSCWKYIDLLFDEKSLPRLFHVFIGHIIHNRMLKIFVRLLLVEGPRTIRLAAVTDRGIKHGSALNVYVFVSVRKGDL